MKLKENIEMLGGKNFYSLTHEEIERCLEKLERIQEYNKKITLQDWNKTNSHLHKDIESLRVSLKKWKKATLISVVFTVVSILICLSVLILKVI